MVNRSAHACFARETTSVTSGARDAWTSSRAGTSAWPRRQLRLAQAIVSTAPARPLLLVPSASVPTGNPAAAVLPGLSRSRGIPIGAWPAPARGPARPGVSCARATSWTRPTTCSDCWPTSATTIAWWPRCGSSGCAYSKSWWRSWSRIQNRRFALGVAAGSRTRQVPREGVNTETSSRPTPAAERTRCDQASSRSAASTTPSRATATWPSKVGPCVQRRRKVAKLMPLLAAAIVARPRGWLCFISHKASSGRSETALDARRGRSRASGEA